MKGVTSNLSSPFLTRASRMPLPDLAVSSEESDSFEGHRSTEVNGHGVCGKLLLSCMTMVLFLSSVHVNLEVVLEVSEGHVDSMMTQGMRGTTLSTKTLDLQHPSFLSPPSSKLLFRAIYTCRRPGGTAARVLKLSAKAGRSNDQTILQHPRSWQAADA